MIWNEWIHACNATLNFGYMNGHSHHLPRLNYRCKIECLQCHLPSIFWEHLPSSNIVVSSNPNLYELATTKEGGLHFILSDSGNYNFDVKAECCGLVDFVKAVIDCGYLRCEFYFRIKEKEKDKFYINFHSTIFI